MIDYFKHIGKHIEWWQITSRGCFRDIEGLPVKVTSELRPEKREVRGIVVAQNCCSVTKSCLTLRPHGLQHARLLYHLTEFAQTLLHCVSDDMQPSHPLSRPSPPSLNLSQNQGLFQWVNSSHQVVKYWSFRFSISPSYEYSGLISFRMDWFYLLAVQGTLKSLLLFKIGETLSRHRERRVQSLKSGR